MGTSNPILRGRYEIWERGKGSEKVTPIMRHEYTVCITVRLKRYDAHNGRATYGAYVLEHSIIEYSWVRVPFGIWVYDHVLLCYAACVDRVNSVIPNA
jgi:hypothetical protein